MAWFSLIISLAAFGLFYSTAYAGDADGVIGDDNAYTFKQNHFEHTTQAYTLAGAANQAMAWPAANKGANGAVVAVTLGADGASQAFTTNAASASGANAGIVQAVNISAQVNDGATTTITTTTKMLTPHATFAPKLVADGGTCASGAVANSAGTVTNNAHQIAGTVTITMSGGNLAAGDYELCYQALGGILRNGTQDIDVANAAHTPLNGNYKLVADGDACSANAVAATTTTAVDADTLRITMGAGADLPAATAYELCYDWGGIQAGGTSDLWVEIGPAQALRLGMTGERISGEESCRIGLTQEVVDSWETGMERAKALATKASKCSPTATAGFKRALLAAIGRGPNFRQGLEARAYEHCVNTGEATIGRENFKQIIM